MPFPFTFSLSVPGLANPFLNHTALSPPPTAVPGHVKQKITRPRPSSSSPPLLLSRKRGWEPAFVEQSRSSTTLASSSGYLDPPAKYIEMHDVGHDDVDEYHEGEMVASDLEMPPAAKRRRGIAGSIVSTALSAALIGTAVGLTVYRLWRDRGRGPDQERLAPPPPYHQGEWTPELLSPSPSLPALPPTPGRSRKQRHAVGSVSRRAAPSLPHRKLRTKHPHAQPPPLTSANTVFSPPQPEFDFAGEEEDVDSQMDWIGDKLSQLIEEGKKALNREIVVMSDAKEDEVDDGCGAWEEDEDQGGKASKRSSSMKRGRKPVPSFDVPTSASLATTSSSSSPQLNRTHSRGLSWSDSIPSHREDEQTWESPELRELMEKARAKLVGGGR